jgi:hypothetical protein
MKLKSGKYKKRLIPLTYANRLKWSKKQNKYVI